MTIIYEQFLLTKKVTAPLPRKIFLPVSFTVLFTDVSEVPTCNRLLA